MLVYLNKHPQAFDPEIVAVLSDALDKLGRKFRQVALDLKMLKKRATYWQNPSSIWHWVKNYERLIDGALAQFKL